MSKWTKNKPYLKLFFWFFIIIITFLVSIIPILVIINNDKEIKKNNAKIKIVTTTTMLKDLVKHLLGDVDKDEPSSGEYQKIGDIQFESLMGVGVDPHNYRIVLSDRKKIKEADLVIFSGLHLEAKMPESLEKLSKKNFLKAEYILIHDKVVRKNDEGAEDPHFWFDVELWKKVAKYFSEHLHEKLPSEGEPQKEENKKTIQKNYNIYSKKLVELNEYIEYKSNDLKNTLKVKPTLVTVHDAFAYFAQKYGFDIESIQGISTQTEAGTANIKRIAKILQEKNIKAMFTETSMPKDALDALQSQSQSLGYEIKVIKNNDGELYSDSLGKEEDESEYIIDFTKKSNDLNKYSGKYKESTYIGAVLHNINLITEKLKN
ncbi:metal ABC transporter solute-binding protein, Zn/Mn family ['Camptotheca acuminata' phytoplasma]|uniref:metal ABC transporter solute-binding protein, Zn/Mn family n=1 Tax='Camptotheca acuminata' phytoplasma TaxID=3239192 RepID=UPI00351A069C